jgi:hypothetical protein
MKNLLNSAVTILIILIVGFCLLGKPKKLHVIKSLEVLFNTKEDQLKELVFTENVGSGGEPSAKTNKSLSDHSEESKAYFKEIALGNEFNDNVSSEPYRWTKDMKIYCYGNCSGVMISELRKVVGELNDIINPIDINIVTTRSEANFVIYFGSYQNFGQENPSLNMGHLKDNWGYFQLFPNRGIMYVDVLRCHEEDAQKHLLREELTQSLGLCNDSWKYENSIFYQGWTTTTEFAPIDRELIDMLYN